MRKKTSIVVIIAAALLVVVVGAAYAYDSSQKDKIADGVTVGGVDVSGMNEEEAAAAVRRKLLAPLRTSLVVSFDGQTWKLSGKKLKIRADIESAVEEAVEDSQEGGFPSRLVRYVSGGEVDEQIAPQVAYSQRAINRFVRHVAEEVDREPQNADVEATPDSLEVVAGKNGRKLRDNLLERKLKAAVLNANAAHKIVATVHPIEPEVTRSEVARKRKKTRFGTCPTPPGPVASPGRRSRRDPRIRSRPAGWGSTKVPGFTAPKRPTRWAPPARTAASGWRFPTSKNCMTS
jgi:hypothetical protein